MLALEKSIDLLSRSYINQIDVSIHFQPLMYYFKIYQIICQVGAVVQKVLEKEISASLLSTPIERNILSLLLNNLDIKRIKKISVLNYFTYHHHFLLQYPLPSHKY
ncbi:hypothetical protein BpHYR1_051316 [Brachionus plicatilis]|uniref:Uncharacterized protein n=1 Tax=Brachionus plicatilis TaxID=10195 RepID=A0A3M7QN58_BRAPC|nr:hypothetical protein BpHYR1_051316 [Brachionus plicatilis]